MSKDTNENIPHSRILFALLIAGIYTWLLIYTLEYLFIYLIAHLIE